MNRVLAILALSISVLFSGCGQKVVSATVLDAVAKSGGGEILYSKYNTVVDLFDNETVTGNFVVCLNGQVYMVSVTHKPWSDNKIEPETSEPLSNATCNVPKKN